MTEAQIRTLQSFDPVLRRWIEKTQPKRVLEWGPGHSTKILVEAGIPEIHSVEHDESWLVKAKEQNPNGVQFHLLSVSARNSNYAAIVEELGGTFDLVFVDGRRRVECALFALMRLSLGGVVLVHDWCRKHYQSPLCHYARVIEVSDNTAVLAPF